MSYIVTPLDSRKNGGPCSGREFAPAPQRGRIPPQHHGQFFCGDQVHPDRRPGIWRDVPPRKPGHDELTGMANTRSWSETISAEKDRRRGPGNGTAVIFIDLDDFKQINDNYGHHAGDHILAEMARRIRTIRADDLVARVGGDEFAVLLRHVPDADDARAVA